MRPEAELVLKLRREKHALIAGFWASAALNAVLLFSLVSIVARHV